MATEDSPQRGYRAACPNCGAPVEFRSAASAFAVCSYCRSSIVRDGEALQRIGQVAELFDDHSPLQLGVAGQLMGRAFTVVGRQQLAYLEPDSETPAGSGISAAASPQVATKKSRQPALARCSITARAPRP